MADERAHQAADHAQTHRRESQAAEPAPPEVGAAAPGSLLGDPRLDGRGNAPVRAAVMRQAQQTYGNRAVQRYLHRQAAPGAPPAPLALQRQDPPGAPAAGPAGAGPAPGPGSAAPGATPAAGLIVEDSVPDAALQPGQMRRSAFLAQARAAVQAAADEVLAGTPFAEVARPQIEQQMATYAGQDSRTLEASVRSQVPGAAGVRAATEYIPLIQTQVREQIRAQLPPTTGVGGALAAVGSAVSGAVSSVAQGIGSAVSSVTSLLFKGREGGARPGADAQAVAGQLQGGQGLDGRLRGGLEAAYGADLSGVRVHTDTRAASASDGLNARAFTVGQDIAFGTGEYQPGTLLGDALIAHEVAHVVQQGQGIAGGVQQKGEGGEAGLEEDADRSAVGAVAALWGGARQGVANVAQNTLPQLRSGLRLQRCGSRSAPAQSIQERLRAITSPSLLADELEHLSGPDLAQVQSEAPGTLLGDGARWEAAVRGKVWATVKTLHAGDTHAFYEAYNNRIIRLIMGGQTAIRVDRTDQQFAAWVQSQFEDLGSKPVGFRLIVEILAAGQPVNIRKTSGAYETERISSEQNPDAGRYNAAQGTPGTPTGSNIGLNPALAQNQVTVGGPPGQQQVIAQDPTVTFGHELIHALHNAQGQNIAPPPGSAAFQILGRPNYLVRNPVTGDPENPEELRTITGQTAFDPPPGTQGAPTWPTSFNVPPGDINENMLRRERDLPDRTTHFGGTRAYSVQVAGGETLEQMLGRYSLGGGAVPGPIMAAVRSTFLEFNPIFRDRPAVPLPPTEHLTLDFPHGEYIALQMAYVLHQPDLAETAKRLRVRGSTNP